MGLFGQADPAGLSEGLEASCHVDPIPEQVATPHHDVPDMNADTELKALLVRSGGRVQKFGCPVKAGGSKSAHSFECLLT